MPPSIGEDRWWGAPPPPPLRLEDGCIHLWRAAQNIDARLQSRLEQSLSPDERSRAHRFVTAELTRDFIAAHGFLRDVLAAYLAVSPADLRFGTGDRGKPTLEAPRSRLRFNLTHSHGLAVVAVCEGREVGVDVEMIRPDVADGGVAERFFSPHEVQSLRRLPTAQQAVGFFNCWTRKEAYLKALGSGLSVPLDRFDVSLAPDQPARLLADRGEAHLDRWALQTFPAAEGWCGALVVEAPDVSLRGYHWSGPLH